LFARSDDGNVPLDLVDDALDGDPLWRYEPAAQQRSVIRSHPASKAASFEVDSGDESLLGVSIGVRESTRLSRQHAVERAVNDMRERVAEPLSLHDMARVAMFSPYHFHRVFRLVTGLPPAQFLSALRMAKACQLLLTTQMRVTDVCYEVGFGSLGTFTTRFARLVGAPPQQLRWLAAHHANQPLAALVADSRDAAGRQEAAVSGWIDAPPESSCIAMLGLFRGDSPHGLPAACTVVRAPGQFSIESLPAGRYHVLAVGFPVTAASSRPCSWRCNCSSSVA
jgi:AraC family transcriptional regulator